MRLAYIEHDTFSGLTNVDRWAEEKGHTLRRYGICDGDPFPDLGDFDRLFLSGAFGHVWDTDKFEWLAREKDFLREALEKDKPMVGFCFGAQLLAEAFGGEVYSAQYAEIGWHPVFLNEEGRQSPVFRNVPERFVTFHWHHDHYKLPEDCVNLAVSELTPHQAFVHATKPAAAFQFHPEYSLELIRTYTAEHGHEWVPGPFAQSRSEVAAQNDRMPETYSLLATLLDNLDNLFG